MGKIFISYRRQDSQDMSGRLYDRLEAQFGAGNVFMDVDSLPLGEKFPERVATAIAECDVFLALIGAQWLDIRDENGRRRLEDAEDYVRLEIEEALRQGVKTVPVLLHDAKMPTKKELPPTCSELATINAPRVRAGSDFRPDMGRLTSTLAAVLADRERRRTEQRAREAREMAEKERRTREHAERPVPGQFARRTVAPLKAAPATAPPPRGTRAGRLPPPPTPGIGAPKRGGLRGRAVYVGTTTVVLLLGLISYLTTIGPPHTAKHSEEPHLELPLARTSEPAAYQAAITATPAFVAPATTRPPSTDPPPSRPVSTNEATPTLAAATPGEPVVPASKPPPVTIAPPAPTTLTTEEIVGQNEASVALIKGNHSSGTGFLSNPRVLVTSRQLVKDEFVESLKVYFPSAKRSDQGPLPATLLYEDDTLDLAILGVETSLKPLTIAASYNFRRGEKLVTIGSVTAGDGVLPNAVSTGVMSTKYEIDKLMYYQAIIAVNSGSLGGPVFDSQGQVIGVVALAPKLEGMAFCIPLAQLRQTLDRIPSLTPQGMLAAQSLHRIRVVFVTLNLRAKVYKLAMKVYVNTMTEAVAQRKDVNAALREVKGDLAKKFAALDQTAVGELKSEVSKIDSDSNLPESTRQKFLDLWANYQELKSYVDRPRGDVGSFVTKSNELSEKHDQLSESLRLILGIREDE